jgi:hypothetical protein
MARYTGPRARICRRLEYPVFESTKFSSIRKSYPPGQHGQSRRRKLSNYGIQLREKQRVKYLYGILEKQFTEDGRIGNLSVIPMQTVYRIFRDEFGNEVKIVQNIDGIFKELDPQYYVHWMINTPDRQAFGLLIIQ